MKTRSILIPSALAITAAALTFPTAAHADGPVTTCADVVSPRTMGPWSQAITGIPAGADVGYAGFAWDEHPAGAGDRDDQAQDERFSIAGRLTPDVPDVNDRDEIAFDGSASPWPGGDFVVAHVRGSLAVQVKVCWTVYPPATTVPEEPTTTAPEPPVPTTAPEPPVPSTVTEPTVPTTAAPEPTITLDPAHTTTTVVLPPPPLPDPAPQPDETGPCRIVMECDDPRFDEPTIPTTVPEATGNTLPATGPSAPVDRILTVGVGVLLAGIFAAVGGSRRRAAR